MTEDTRLTQIDVLIAESRGWKEKNYKGSFGKPSTYRVMPGGEPTHESFPSPTRDLSAAFELLGEFGEWAVYGGDDCHSECALDMKHGEGPFFDAEADTPQLAISLAYCAAKGIEVPE